MHEGDAEAFFGTAVLGKLGPRAKGCRGPLLYRYLEKKTDTTSLAPVFNTLLGSFDEAAKGFMLKLLQPKVSVIGTTRSAGSIPIFQRCRTGTRGISRTWRPR